MGRQARTRNQVNRRRSSRERHDRVLIVCEGYKTEPNYFVDIRNDYKLSSVNIKVKGTGTHPSTVVREAKKLRKEARRQGNAYDRIYCVFDRDEHIGFDQTCNEAMQVGLKLARSWPCFEFWLLLHYGQWRRPFSRSGTRSQADQCIQELRKRFPEYEKGKENIFSKLKHQLEEAKINAASGLRDAKQTGECDPSTEIHLLVEYLQSLTDRG